MSHDEIVFDEVRYREPERRCRPDRDRSWACLAYEVPGPIDLPIFLERMTADAIERHALRDTSVELGGILLGKECLDEATGQPFVMVTRSLEAKHYENTQASFTYTHDSWEEITRERDRLHPELDIVGWYHTHPDFGIFLSSHDQFIHRHFFAQPLQVAYVVDPIRQTRGFFQWRDGALEQVGGYSLFAARGDRVALARLVNDLENLPNAEGGGGGLSPRLEAELIAMLTRPAPPYATAADRVQTAALFSLIGGLVGMVVLGAAVWLYHLNRELALQGQRIEATQRSAQDLIATQRLAIDTLLSEAGKGRPFDFARRYDDLARERDGYRDEVDRWKTIDAALNDRARRLDAENSGLRKKLDDAKPVLELYKRETKDVPDLQSRIGRLEADLESAKELLGAATDKEQAAKLLKKYHRTWYAAVAGWGVGAAAILGLLAMLAQQGREPPDDQPEPRPEPPPPPHRIL